VDGKWIKANSEEVFEVIGEEKLIPLKVTY
jgi:hypothetical protein